MAVSQNGWHVFTSPPEGTIPEYITGRVRPKDVDVIFTYLCDRIHKEVEEINVNWSWGWAFRSIRGVSSGYSNHASATAIDVNAPAHPLGVTNTWSESEKDKVHQILRELDGVVRWGEDYSGRKDGMHFEINDTPERVSAVAERIRSGKIAAKQTDQKRKRPRAIHFGRVQEQFLIAAGVEKGEIVQRSGVALIQRALNRVLDLNLTADGLVGPATLKAWAQWEDMMGGLGRKRIPDRKSVEELAETANIRVVDMPESKDDDKPKMKTIHDVAREVIEGEWGDGDERRTRLTNAGYNHKQVQRRVGELLS